MNQPLAQSIQSYAWVRDLIDAIEHEAACGSPTPRRHPCRHQSLLALVRKRVQRTREGRP